MPDGATKGESKLLGLELVRFVCAFAVLVWHYQHFYHAGGAQPFVRDGEPLYWLLSPFYQLGLYGVQFFWGISGFIFFWKYGAAIADGAISGRKFFVLRFSRLYPLHLVTLLLVAALQPLHVALTGAPFIYDHNSVSQFLLHLGLASQWVDTGGMGFNGPVWSVSAEVFVYALFFVAMRLLGRHRMAVAVLFTAAAVAIQLAGESSRVVNCISFFFVGGIAAELNRKAAGDKGASVVAAMALAVILGGAWQTGMLSREGAPVLLLLVLPPLLILAAREWRALDRWQGPIEAAGNMTYSTYLCHFPLQLAVVTAAAASGLTVTPQSPLILIAYLGATLVIGRLVYSRFELPAQDAIRGWYRERRSLATA